MLRTPWWQPPPWCWPSRCKRAATGRPRSSTTAAFRRLICAKRPLACIRCWSNFSRKTWRLFETSTLTSKFFSLLQLFLGCTQSKRDYLVAQSLLRSCQNCSSCEAGILKLTLPSTPKQRIQTTNCHSATLGINLDFFRFVVSLLFSEIYWCAFFIFGLLPFSTIFFSTVLCSLFPTFLSIFFLVSISFYTIPTTNQWRVAYHNKKSLKKKLIFSVLSILIIFFVSWWTQSPLPKWEV